MPYQYLSKEDMSVFKTYQHSTEKTTLDTFYCNHVFNHYERCLPRVK